MLQSSSSPVLLIRLHEAPYPTFLEYQASRFRSHAYTVLPQTKKISRLRSKCRYGKAVFSHRFLSHEEGLCLSPCSKQVILLLIRNKKRALPSGDALFDLLCLSKVLVSNAQDRSFGQVPPILCSHTSSASSRIRARLFSQPRQGSVMDLP